MLSSSCPRSRLRPRSCPEWSRSRPPPRAHRCDRDHPSEAVERLGVGWPYELSAPTGTTAIFGVHRLKKSGAEKIFELVVGHRTGGLQSCCRGEAFNTD